MGTALPSVSFGGSLNYGRGSLARGFSGGSDTLQVPIRGGFGAVVSKNDEYKAAGLSVGVGTSPPFEHSNTTILSSERINLDLSSHIAHWIGTRSIGPSR